MAYSLPDGDRVYAIGDIHGHVDLLERLLTRIEAHCRLRPVPRVTLVYLGDYIDRGPASAQVIDRVLEQPAWATRVVRILGNHEDRFHAFLTDRADDAAYLGAGGQQTLVSYGVETRSLWLPSSMARTKRALLARLPAAHLELLESGVVSERIGGFFFCHAGIMPGVPLSEQDRHDLQWIRKRFHDSADDHGAIVVHGHTTVDQPELLANRINIDTHAYKSGVLTAAVIEENRVHFLDTRQR